MPLATYAIESLPVLESEVPTNADGVVYVCSTCGRLWGRVDSGTSRFLPEDVPCQLHRPVGVADQFRIPGSLLPIVHEPFNFPGLSAVTLAHLPPELVRREFFLHLAHFEKVLSHGNQTSQQGGESRVPDEVPPP